METIETVEIIETGEFEKKPLPRAAATLVLGIMSIVSCWMYGFIGVILGIVALVVSKESFAAYKANPEAYTGGGNMKAGRTMAIVGLSLSAFVLLMAIIAIVAGTAFFSSEGFENFINSF